jgi:hypothetical protein
MHVPITNISFACIAATRRANDYAFAVAAFAAARDIAWWTASHRSVRMNRIASHRSVRMNRIASFRTNEPHRQI